MRNQAFFVVGHSNWGKSKTLEALAGPPQVRYWAVGNRRFFIRRMSNDDLLDKWADFIKKLDPTHRSHVIVAMCPNSDALRVLAHIKDKYQLYFWVLRHSYQDSGSISAQEEQALRALGKVDIFAPKADATTRAAAFQNFILANP